MGGDCGSWTDQQRFDSQIPNFDSTSAWIRQYVESQNLLPNYMYPWHATTATGQDITLSATARPQSHFDIDNGKPHKQFLVFDHTGDQTTMIFSSGVGAPPVHRLSNWKVKQAESSILQPRQNGSNMMGNADAQLIDDFIDIRKFEEDLGSDLQSEMHEDTEELNALMYSDGDTDSDDDEYEDEVTSTCHSPTTLKIHDKQNGFAEIREEVASSDEEPTKKRKLSNGGNEFTLADDHIIVSHGTFAVEDDTGSHCGSAALCSSGKSLSHSGRKRSRKDRIRERVRTLQSMIPCGNSANPIEVIDEAISFLISLKLKAKSVVFDSI